MHSTFADAIRDTGLTPPEHIMPGKIYRFPGIDKGRSNTAGWCRLFDDGRGGVFGDYARGFRQVWQAPGSSNATGSARPKFPSKTQPKPEPSKYALTLWRGAEGETGSHPYATRKGITWPAAARRGCATGRIVGQSADCIIVPIRDVVTGTVFAVQAINHDGDKQTFGPLKGHGLLIGNPLDKNIPWYVAEGWATAVSMVFHHHHGNAVCAAAFGKSNLETLADRLAADYSPLQLAILREVDA